jgi:hypothetical protein
VALDRALAEDPEYQMARTLHEALVFGLSPALLADWPAVNRGDFAPGHPSGNGQSSQGRRQQRAASRPGRQPPRHRRRRRRAI